MSKQFIGNAHTLSVTRKPFCSVKCATLPSECACQLVEGSNLESNIQYMHTTVDVSERYTKQLSR